jgi:uncharacterized membrane protein
MHGVDFEVLLVLAVLALILVAGIGSLLGLIAWFRVRALERRVLDLQRSLEGAKPARAPAHAAPRPTATSSFPGSIPLAPKPAQAAPEAVVLPADENPIVPHAPETPELRGERVSPSETGRPVRPEPIVLPSEGAHVIPPADERVQREEQPEEPGVVPAQRPEAIVLPPTGEEHAPLVVSGSERELRMRRSESADSPEPIVLPELDEEFVATSLDDEAARRAPPKRPSAGVDWERWIGVRGAAVVGAVVLAIAGFLFLQYSIQKGLITPRMRVIGATGAGIACVAFGLALWRRRYEVLGNSLCGAGAVILYAAAWAAYKLYGLIPFPVAFGAMAAVTVACAWIASRHSSQLVAVLGMTGGFATPLALSTGQDRPVQLFGYVLLVDLGFLFVAHKRRWPNVGLLALVFTFVIQALWIFARLDAARLGLGLAILGVFALVFAWWSTRRGALDEVRGRLTQAGAVLLPFLFAVYFAQHAELGRDLWPPIALALLLALAAGWMARVRAEPWLPLGTAAGSLALCLTWVATQHSMFLLEQHVELALCLLAIAAAHHLFVELPDRTGSRSAALAGATAAVLGGLVPIAICMLRVRPDPWVAIGSAGLLALAAQRLVARGAAAPFALAGGVFAGWVPFAWSLQQSPEPPAGLAWLCALALLGLALLAGARLLSEERRRAAFAGAAACAVMCLLALLASDLLDRATPIQQLASTLLLGGLLLLGVTGARASVGFALAALATFLAQRETGALDREAWSVRGAGAAGLALAATGGALFAAWPLVAARTWLGSRHVWRIAALASLPWAWALTSNLDHVRGRSASWIVPAAFAALHALLALGAPRILARTGAPGESTVGIAGIARTWHGAAALFWLAWVPALLADVAPREVAALALWTAGLAWFAARERHGRLGLAPPFPLALATLLVLGQLFAFHPRASWWLSGELAWLCFLPAVCALACARWLRALAQPAPALACAVCAVLAVFVGLNLQIAHAWADTERFRFSLAGRQGPNLTTSLCWAIYALALLAIGVRKAASAPRWASLALLLVTIGKVFLFDLGNLEGLYRVGAMLGLALSLILVSLLYQRFVFRRVAREPAT